MKLKSEEKERESFCGCVCLEFSIRLVKTSPPVRLNGVRCNYCT